MRKVSIVYRTGVLPKEAELKPEFDIVEPMRFKDGCVVLIEREYIWCIPTAQLVSIAEKRTS